MTETASAPAVVLDDFGTQAKTRLGDLIAKRNAKAETIAAASGDSQGLLENLRTSSDDKTVVSLNEQIAALDEKKFALETKRDEILKPLVESIKADAAAKIEPLTAEVDEFDKQIRAASNYLKSMYGAEAVADLPNLVSRKGRETGGGNGGRRVKGFDVYVDGVIATLRDAKGVERSNLAAAAKVAGVETADIQKGFFDAQGTTESKSYKDSVEFTVAGKKDDKDHTFTIKAVRGKDDDSDSE
jgi:hypothetical protein